MKSLAVWTLLLGCNKAPDKETSATTETGVHTGDTVPTETGDDTGPDSDSQDTETDTEPPTETGTSEDVEIVEGGTVTCANPEERETLGPLYLPNTGGDWDTQIGGSRYPPTATAPGYGLAVADFTGDDRLDIFLPNFGANQLFVQQDGFTFTEEAAKRGLAGTTEPSDGATAVDIDGDGDLDLAVFNRGDTNQLYLNDAGTFTATDIGSTSLLSVSGAFADMDLDGDLDLVVANRDQFDDSDFADTDDNTLFENTGDGTLVEVTERMPLPGEDEYTFVVGWLDLDGDLLPEIYVANDHGGSHADNRLLRNTGTGFEDISDEYAFNQGISSMGVGVGEINGDDLPDLAISNWGAMLLLESWEDGTFIQAQAAREFEVLQPSEGHWVSWGLDLVDIDNDGDLDAPITTGPVFTMITPTNPPDQPNQILVRNGDVFDQAGPDYGFAEDTSDRGLAAIDLDTDGALDLIVRPIDGPARLYKQRCGANSWIEIGLTQPAPNTQAIGARIRVVADGVEQWRYVMAGGTSLATGLAPIAHFGLADAEQVDTIEVHWPDGETSVVSGVEARQKVMVNRLF